MRTFMIIAALTLTACSSKETSDVQTTTDSAAVTIDSAKVDSTVTSTDTVTAK